ncbi:kinase [Mergibacter septicus]|uniref:lipopolysaccharide kinase InaA family protein n=1 Tax=Mergibacter septicus TaxID=221402 RepID=UPI0011792C84|nr:lipopolysaccharide kinase InaA family protein [Mergibacter septicus]AWX13263.1 kinase [Mergibacter septicus]
MTFEQIVTLQRKENPDKRVFPFIFNQKKYWLKQVEKLSGGMRLLKFNPQKALQRELSALQYLNQRQAPIAKVVAYGEDYFVTEDVGTGVDDWLKKPISAAQKQRILCDSAKALAQLHQQQLTHGRPALRDITWQAEKVYFIDFETVCLKSNSPTQLNKRKIRDILVFIHSLFLKQLDLTIIQQTVQAYCQAGGMDNWLATKDYLHHYRGIYYFLNLCKPIARSDLIAILQLFEFVLKKSNNQ